MTQTTAPAPASAAALPNASIDLNQLLANDADGKTGEALFAGAMLVEPSVSAESSPPATAPEDREPAAADTVTYEATGGSWFAVTASWLAEPIKVQGEANAQDKVAALTALIPSPAA
ncbi:hypothetical protein [Sphingomonas panaciterrae]|uniref:hypothetical protein n=1 Tax=Sphingomonas panaciterrae TaxID=1462999 RepID=UPI002FF04190